jgi:hypothetical protein
MMSSSELIFLVLGLSLGWIQVRVISMRDIFGGGRRPGRHRGFCRVGPECGDLPFDGAGAGAGRETRVASWKPPDARARPNIGKNCWFGNTLAAQKRRSKNFGAFDARAVSVRRDASLEVNGCCIA